MNNKIIQDILKNKINFSVFNITEMTEEQMEVVYHNLKSKIEKENNMFEKMLENQKNSEEGFYNKKTIQIIIQYLLNENKYTTTDIKSIITKVINMYEMIEEITEEKEENTMTDLIADLNLGEIEEFTKYINNLTEKQYQMMKNIILNETEIDDFLDEIIQPYIQYHYNNSERFVSVDLIYDFLVKLNKDKTEKNKSFYINKIIDYILGENKILRLALVKDDVSVISNYLNVLTVYNQKVNEFIKSVNQENINRIKKNLPKDFQTFDEHREHIDVSSLNKKADIQIIEIMYIAEIIALKKFLKIDLQFNENKMNKILINLEKINIKTYYKLENVVLNNQFVKMVRQNGKVLPGKIVKMIIYKILDKNDKLKIEEKEVKIVKNKVDMDFEFSKISIQNNKITIQDLKEQQMNLRNLIVLLKENGENTTEQENKLKTIEEQIKKEHLKMDSEDILNENIDEVNNLMNNMNLTINEKTKMTSLINVYNKELMDQVDKYGENFNKENQSSFINNNIDKNLENLINKYEKDSKEEEKKEKKERFNKLQNDLVNEYFKTILSQIDNIYKINNMRLYEMLSDFIKHQMNTKIIPRIYKNFDLGNSKFTRNENVYHNLKVIIHMFTIMLNFTNKQVDYTKVYDGLDKIVNTNKKMKKVFLKTNQKFAELIEERENEVVIQYLGEEIVMKKNEVEMIEDLVGKSVKIIKGNYKGFQGIIYLQKNDYVLITKDLYGKNGNSELPRITTMKLKYDQFKVNEDIENEKFMIENQELYDYYNKVDKKLYPMTKFEINKYYPVDELKNFEQIYKMCIELINDYKTNEYNQFEKMREMKKEYVELKNKVNEKKGNKREYIKLNKSLKKLHKDIRNMEKNIRLIKETLINNSQNLNDNYTYQKVDGVFKLKEHIIVVKQQQKERKTAEEKKQIKKIKLENEKLMRNNMIESMTSQITNIIGDLF